MALLFPALLFLAPLISGCSSAPAPKPELTGLLDRIGQIGNLTDSSKVSSEVGVPFQPLTRYYLGPSGAQLPDVVNYVTKRAVPGLAGVTIDQYQVEFAGGTAIPAPASDKPASQTMIAFSTIPAITCVTLATLQRRFGGDGHVMPIPDGWGSTREWRLRQGQHFSNSLTAQFGTSSDQCATSITIRQIHAG